MQGDTPCGSLLLPHLHVWLAAACDLIAACAVLLLPPAGMQQLAVWHMHPLLARSVLLASVGAGLRSPRTVNTVGSTHCTNPVLLAGVCRGAGE